MKIKKEKKGEKKAAPKAAPKFTQLACRKMHDQGMTDEEIADKLGKSPAEVRRMRKRGR